MPPSRAQYRYPADQPDAETTRAFLDDLERAAADAVAQRIAVRSAFGHRVSTTDHDRHVATTIVWGWYRIASHHGVTPDDLHLAAALADAALDGLAAARRRSEHGL